MKKVLGLLVVSASVLTLVGCKKDSDKEELRINIAMGNSARQIGYANSEKLEIAGKSYSNGQLKPVWDYIASDAVLDYTLVDTATGNTMAAMMDVEAATGFEDSHIYGGSGNADRLVAAGADDGEFIDLNEYMDSGKLPNMKKYYEENPNVKSYFEAHDGGLYHAGYVAEIDNYARGFNGRTEWVEVLLNVDKEGVLSTTETATLDVAFDSDDNTVLAAQDAKAASNGGKLKFEDARDVLIKHIDDNYTLTQRSDLYNGGTAQYDMDELIALWRVMKLAPKTLSKFETGTENAGMNITPFFPRQQSYAQDVLRLGNYLEGQRVFGADSYGSRFYLDANGEFTFSHTQDGFVDSVEKLNQLFSEGLIFEDFNNTEYKSSGKIRTAMYTNDYVDGNNNMGFMTYDWWASTTKTTSVKEGEETKYKVSGMLPPLVELDDATVAGMDAVAVRDNMYHWVDNGRAMKPDGWSISKSATGKNLEKALQLFDYMYSEEGSKVQNFGTPDMWEDNKYDSNGDEKLDSPKISDEVIAASVKYKSGDLSGFLRDYIGAIIPVGYQKDISAELQGSVQNAIDARQMYIEAKVLFPSYDEDNNPFFQMVPPIFSLDPQDAKSLVGTDIGDTQTAVIINYINGSGELAGKTGTALKEAIIELYNSKGFDKYFKAYDSAYDRMIGNE